MQMSTKEPLAAQTAAARWRLAHPNTASGVPSHLFTDENPACTIKGTGFRDRQTALRTITLTSQPGVRFKQHWTIMAMRERAANHPHQSAGMREAISVYDDWLRDYVPPDPVTVREELQAHRARCSSAANKHSYPAGSEPHERQRIQLAQQDITRGQQQLANGIRAAVATSELCASVQCDLASITAVFGGPGMHGYGTHTVDKGEHVVLVEPESQVLAIIGARKIPLVVPIKLQCCYKESCAALHVQVSMPTGFKSIEQLWGSVKRAKTDHVQEERQAVEQGTRVWVCALCTFRHTDLMAEYLACHVCQTSRR